MPADSRFDAPRSLARALAEIARRDGGTHAAEAELRAALPAALGSWLHSRLKDVRLDGRRCTLVMADASGAREAAALSGEVLAELRKRLGAGAPASLIVERAPEPRRARKEPPPPARARPLVEEALREVRDPALRARLARWAGVTGVSEPPTGGSGEDVRPTRGHGAGNAPCLDDPAGS